MQKDIIGVIQNFNFCLKIDNLRYYRKVNISGGNKKICGMNGFLVVSELQF